MKSKALHRKSRVENGIRNKIPGKVFSTRAEYKSRACMTKTDLEALNTGIDFGKKSIEVMSQLAAGEKKMDVRVVLIT